MPIINPTQLVEEYKKSGEFDRLRRDLLAQFREGEGLPSFMNGVEEIIRKKLSSDGRLLSMSETSLSRELLQDLNRYPIVQRAVAEFPSLSDPAFAAGIRQHVTKILQDDRAANGGTKPDGPPPTVNGNASSDKPVLAVQTQPEETRKTENGNSHKVAEDAVRPSDAQQVQSAAPDGNESEDSAMLESPISERNPSSGGEKATPSVMEAE